MKNHFFIVGAQRSGTTYLYDMLDQHPEICMAKPVRPEPKYFIGKNRDEIDYTEYFHKFFTLKREYKIYGEKSTAYYERDESARLISSFFPSAKIIFLLRDPVQRALSNYYFSVQNSLEKRSLEEVFLGNNAQLPPKPDNVSVNPYDYLGRGEYSKFIELYRKYFPATQIKTIIFEELISNPAIIKELYSFLRVSKVYIPENAEVIVNASEKDMNAPKTILQSLKKHFTGR